MELGILIFACFALLFAIGCFIYELVCIHRYNNLERSIKWRVRFINYGEIAEAYHYGKTRRKILKQYAQEQLIVVSIEPFEKVR